MGRIAGRAIAVLVLVAWALPCHDAEAKRKFARMGAGGGEAAKAAAVTDVPADSVSIRRDVDAGNAQFLKAWMTGDAVLFAACFAEDGAMLRPGGRVILGRDTIRVRMAAVFARYRMTTGTISTLYLHIIGDRAYETGRWVFTIAGVGEAGRRQRPLRARRARAVAGLRAGSAARRRAAHPRRYGHPPDKQEKATETVLEQAALLAAEWADA